MIWDRIPRARIARVLLSTALAAPALHAADEAPVWDARSVEHLYNRAGFGAGPEEIDAAVQRGLEACVADLLDSDPAREPAFLDPRPVTRRGVRLPLSDATPEQRRQAVDRVRSEFTTAMPTYEQWWVQRMLEGTDPLRDRMTLFWHGLIPSNKYTVRYMYEMIDQHQFLRENALGSLRTILIGMAKDAAMLRYLDNATNVKGHPNENWARELMELFSLGEGNYTEKDIQEAARAFTGWSKESHHFVFHETEHDLGMKTVLGVSGRLDGGDIVDIILEQPACGRYIARRIISYFEGTGPDEARLEEYAQFLRDSGYEIAPFMRKLLLDPRFYRAEVVGTRIAGPIDYLIGAARRMEAGEVDRVILAGGATLGQHLFAPPSVKGWDGGMEWINSATIIQRSNLSAVVLGLLEVQNLMYEDLPDGAAGEAMMAEKNKNKGRIGLESYEAIRRMQRDGWEAEIDLTSRMRANDAASDGEIVDALLPILLAVPVEPGLAPPLKAQLAALREEHGADEGELLDHESSETMLRQLALLVLSLPEAQLN